MVAYSDVSSRGGRPVSRRLDVSPASAAPPPPAGDKAAPPRPPAPGPLTITLTNDTLSFNIVLAQQEMYLLRNLMGLSIPHLTGWQYQLSPASFDPAHNLASGGTGAGASAREFGGGTRRRMWLHSLLSNQRTCLSSNSSSSSSSSNNSSSLATLNEGGRLISSSSSSTSLEDLLPRTGGE